MLWLQGGGRRADGSEAPENHRSGRGTTACRRGLFVVDQGLRQGSSSPGANPARSTGNIPQAISSSSASRPRAALLLVFGAGRPTAVLSWGMCVQHLTCVRYSKNNKIGPRYLPHQNDVLLTPSSRASSFLSDPLEMATTVYPNLLAYWMARCPKPPILFSNPENDRSRRRVQRR